MVKSIIAALVFLLLTTTVKAAMFSATVDRQQLAIDEHLALILSLTHSDTRLRAQGESPNVDLTLLSADFDVGTAEPKHNYNIFRSRGRASSELTIALFPKRQGRLMIPSFTVDGATTAPIAIEVLPSPHADAPLAFSRSGVNKITLWQGEQLLIYLDLYTRVELNSAKLGGELESEPTPLELFEYARLANSEREEAHNGFNYHVTRSQWALFPDQAGALTLYLPDTWVVTSAEQRIRLPHQRHTVTVKPLPDGVPPTIMVGRPQLHLETLTDPHQVGQLGQWQITLTTAALSTLLPPTLAVSAPAQLQVYQDRPSFDRELNADGMLNMARYRLSATASELGRFQFGTISLPYFDPNQGALKQVALAGPQLTITMPAANPNTTTTAAQKTRLQPDKNDNSLKWGWPIATTLFALLWLATLVRLRQRRGTSTQKPKTEKVSSFKWQPTARPLEQQLCQALGSTSLVQGLAAWESQFGSNPTLKETVCRVQQLYYGKARHSGAADLNEKVNQACQDIARIRKQAAIRHQLDPWSPHAFTAKLPES